MRWWRTGMILLAVLMISGCSSNSRNSVPATPTDTPTPIFIPTPQGTTSACPPAPAPLDDRSSATKIVLSYYNALNLQDYQRAYGYLSPLAPLATPTPVTKGPTPTPQPPLPTFPQWKAGYAQTACDIITYTGPERPVTDASGGYAGIGTGIVIPISLTAILTDDSLQQFSGIYVIRYDPAQGLPETGYIDLAFSQLTAQ